MDVKCPVCGKIQTQKPIKSWSYGKVIEKRDVSGTTWGASIKCARYLCKCGNLFNFYLTTKNKSWTIPKPKNKSWTILKPKNKSL